MASNRNIIQNNKLKELQKLLDQKNRELEIEAAVERVQARTMAMNKSDELREVVSIIYKGLEYLGIDISLCLILVYDWKTKNMEWWSSGQGMDILPKSYRIPISQEMEENALVKRYFSDLQKGVDYSEFELNGDVKRNWDNFIFNYSDLKNIPEEVKSSILSYNRVLLCDAFMSCGTLEISMQRSLTGEEIYILKRFAKVIDLTFTRVRDLQKAEEQARKAQIEAALERVRARSMGMHKSEELVNVVVLINTELLELGVNQSNSVLMTDWDINNLEAGACLWLGVAGQEYLHRYHVPFNEEHTIDANYLEARKKNINFYTESFTKEEKDNYFLYHFKNGGLGQIPEDRKKFILDAKGYSRAVVSLKNSGLFVQRYSDEPFTKEQLKVIERFGIVFEQTYTRFLDLKKAEEQAREAKIEAALEKIRSRTMAMRKSDELKEVVALVAERLHELGIILDAGGVIICTYFKNSKDVMHWLASPDFSYSGRYLLPYFDHVIFNDAWNSRLSGEEFFTKAYSIEEKDSFFKYAFEHSDYKYFPDDFKQWMFAQKKHTLSFAWSKNSALLIPSHTGFVPSEPDRDILKRFAKVFEQAYIRFLDIQKAEIQARETLKQASLDRVRGEIASMRNSEDLNRITPVIWHELQALEVPFFRCGVFIVDEDAEIVRVYLTTPEGTALGVLNLSFDANELAIKTVEHWRKKQILKTYWNKEEFENWTKSMMKLGQVQNAETYQGSSTAPESLNLHFVPFQQGMLYVGDVSPLSDEKIELVKTLAEAFSIAYARYEDFKNLEDAKNKIELTLRELKAAQAQLIQSEKMASLGELTAGIAHEIQNPLNFVNNFSEINKELLFELKEEIEKGNQEEVIAIADDVIGNEEKINQHGKRAESIVKGMLLHSRGSSGQKEFTDINALCDEYLRLSYHGFRAKDKSFNANFKLETDKSLPKIEVVPQDIGRVLLNLINNAFYAVKAPPPPEGGIKKSQTEHKPTVVVKTSYIPPTGGPTRPDDPVGRGGACLISVSDNGPGIPDSIKDKIFQPFFTTKPTGQGTGLGLSLAYDIVKAHGGEIKVESKEGVGTEFTIHISIT